MNELDINALVAELDEEFQEAPEDSEPAVVSEEQEDIEEEIIDEPLEEDEEEEEEEIPVDDEDLHKRNEAFKALREERDRLKQSDAFLEKLATQYGMTKDDLIKQFAEQQTKKEAEEAGIPPEQMQRIKELEEKAAKAEEERLRTVFNVTADTFAKTHNLDNNDMGLIFQESARLGVDITKNPELMEVIYRSISYDDAVEQGRQRQLETTRKRSKTSVGKTGTQGTQVTIDQAQAWEAEIDAILRENHILKDK